MAIMTSYAALPPLRIPRLHGVGARFSPWPTIFTRDRPVATNRLNVHRFKILNRLAQVPPDTLRWRVVSDVSRKSIVKAVMRNRLKRRWANAFADALRQHGYRANGQRIMAPGTANSDSADRDLTGTLEILSFSDTGLTLDYRDMVGSAGILVRAIRDQIRRQVVTRTGTTRRDHARPTAPPATSPMPTPSTWIWDLVKPEGTSR